MVAGIIINQLLTIAQIPLGGGILQNGAVNMFQCIQPDLRGWQIGLTNVEMVYFDSALFGGGGQGCQLAYGRLWHLVTSN